MNRIVLSLSLVLFACFPANFILGQGKTKTSDDELTLEKLFPEKSLFGPQARSAEFSHDGRYAAFLYRTNESRRHGNDLWLFDFKTNKLVQVTRVSDMTEFQKSAREVKEDRLAKHEAAQKAKEQEKADDKKSDKKTDKKDPETSDKTEKNKKAEAGKQKKKTQKEIEQELEIVNSPPEGDADEEDAPRYSGISSFQWHPKTNSMVIVSEGDIYHLKDVGKPNLQRLTKTESGESSVEFLPDGNGFVYQNGDVVNRVLFDNHLIEQINPQLAGGQSLSRYSLSPDGKRLALIASTGSERFNQGSRTVDIIRYRDRFAKSDTIPRTVSDDEVKPSDVYVYMFDLEKSATEQAELIQVFKTTIDEPRDVISLPQWSLDSQKITFCFFNQENSEVEIQLSEYPSAEDLENKIAERKKQKPKKEAKDENEDESDNDNPTRRARREVEKPIEFPARTVYQFKHIGGPNTPNMVAPNFVWDNQHIMFVSELSGFRQVHLLDPLYESVNQLTNGNFEVYPIRLSDDRKFLFATATKDSPSREMVYKINLENGELEKLSRQDGTYENVAVSNDGTRILANFVTYGSLVELVQQNGKSKTVTLTDSHTEEAKKLTKQKPEFFDYANRHGHTIHGMMFKPKGWKKSQKYPLLIYVYGGPLGTRKSVVDGSYSSDGYFFQMYMAQKHGYVTAVIDPRGQSGYGGMFEKANYEQVGKPQVEDLVDGVKYLTEECNIDDQRVAIYGWSFGGFQTQMCLYTEPDVFQVGIAGAGPTEWENYNAWYTTGTVGPSRKGEPDQKKYSLLPLAKNLQGKLLLIHGMEDTNVLFQDTVAVYRELLKAGKETNVELFLDPTGGHGLGGDVKRLNRMRKYEEFLLRTLGSKNK